MSASSVLSKILAVVAAIIVLFSAFLVGFTTGSATTCRHVGRDVNAYWEFRNGECTVSVEPIDRR